MRLGSSWTRLRTAGRMRHVQFVIRHAARGGTVSLARVQQPHWMTKQSSLLKTPTYTNAQLDASSRTFSLFTNTSSDRNKVFETRFSSPNVLGVFIALSDTEEVNHGPSLSLSNISDEAAVMEVIAGRRWRPCCTCSKPPSSEMLRRCALDRIAWNKREREDLYGWRPKNDDPSRDEVFSHATSCTAAAVAPMGNRSQDNGATTRLTMVLPYIRILIWSGSKKRAPISVTWSGSTYQEVTLTHPQQQVQSQTGIHSILHAPSLKTERSSDPRPRYMYNAGSTNADIPGFERHRTARK